MLAGILAYVEIPSFVPQGLRDLLSGPERVRAAHDARRRYRELSDRDVADAGVSREDLLGLRSHQPAVPFFMQPGFGSRAG